MSSQDWTNNPSFLALSPEKQAILKQFNEQIKGKSPRQSIPFFIQTMNTLKARNMSFSHEETKLLIEQLSGNLSPAEKAAFETIRQKLH